MEEAEAVYCLVTILYLGFALNKTKAMQSLGQKNCILHFRIKTPATLWN